MEKSAKSNVKVFKSSRGGIKLEMDGFIYEKNIVQSDKYYWLCEMRRNKKYNCNVRIITIFNSESNMHTLITKKILDHNHDPDVIKSKVANIINLIKEDSIHNNAKKPSQIINDCLTTTSDEITTHLPTIKNLKQVIYRIKKRESANH